MDTLACRAWERRVAEQHGVTIPFLPSLESDQRRFQRAFVRWTYTFGAGKDAGSLARAKDGASPGDTDGQAAPTEGRTPGECMKADIGRDCRCPRCTEDRVAEADYYDVYGDNYIVEDR
jgi:hypothetical protein